MKKVRKVMVTEDYHIPFLDITAYNIMKKYLKDYSPDIFIINGDFVDFYTLSTFDKNPDRTGMLAEEIKEARKKLKEILKLLPHKCKVYMLEGNHEQRMQRFLWRNPELYGLDSLDIQNILEIDDKRVTYIQTDLDYWKKDNGHLKLGDMVIMHGDNRLNGASYSKNSGYSASNTIRTLLSNILIGHVHRLGVVYTTSMDNTYVGIEGGCLCVPTGTANWQQGFVTFEIIKNKSVNVRTHHINNGGLIEDGKIYTGA